MKKSIISKGFCTVLCLIAIFEIAITAGAIEVMPFYNQVNTARCSLDISAAGKATAEVTVTTREYASLQGTIQLKKVTDNGEQTVATWSASGSMRLSETRTCFVTSGYAYKLYASVSIYSTGGVYCETVYLESDEIYYG